MPSIFPKDLAVDRLVYLDSEFTDMLDPELLSLGLVSASGDEHYVELDLDDPASAATLLRASDFVRHCGVLDQWGRIPGSATTREQMGLRTARWLLEWATRSGQPALIAFDYATDYELLERLLRDTGQWNVVRDVVQPLNVDELANRFDGVLGAEAAYDALKRRGIERHHALADAHALRAACTATLTGKRICL